MSRTSRLARRARRIALAAAGALCLASTAASPALAVPADYAGPGVTHALTTTQQATTNGDSPADRVAAPTIVQPVPVSRPDRTPVLPIVLAGLAVLVALAGGAEMLAQRRTPRPRLN